MFRKIELFLRGEWFLHCVTMFMLMILIIRVALYIGFYLPLWFLLPIPFIVAYTWELGWKLYAKKEISISDITGTVIGGLLAITILRI